MLQFPKRNSGARASESQPKKWERRKRKRTPNEKQKFGKPKKKKTRSYKQQIRDLERALNGKRQLPEHIKKKKMKELKRLKQNRNSHDAEARCNHRTLRHNNQYGGPKFFDKRKLMRKLDQNTRALANTTDIKEKEELNAKRTEIMDDLYYIAHFPKHIKYVSIIMARKKNDSKQLEKIEQIKKHIRGVVEDSESDDDPDFEEEVRKQAMKKIEDSEKIEHEIVEKPLEDSKKANDEKFEDPLLQVDSNDIDDPLLTFASESEEDVPDPTSSKPSDVDAVAAFLAEESDSEEQKETAPLSRKEKRKQAIAEARRKKKKAQNET